MNLISSANSWNLTTDKVFNIIQYFLFSYYANFDLIEMQLSNAQLYENYVMTVKYSGLQEHKGKMYTKKQFYEILTVIKEHPLLTIEHFEGKYPKLYIFIMYIKEKNIFKTIVYDFEKENDNRYSNYSKERYKNALLSVVNPVQDIDNKIINDFIQNFEEIKNNIILLKNTDEEIMYKMSIRIDDIISDIYGFENNFINPRLIMKYLDEDINKEMSYSWKGAKDKLKITVGKEKEDYSILVKCVY